MFLSYAFTHFKTNASTFARNIFAHYSYEGQYNFVIDRLLRCRLIKKRIIRELSINST